MIYIQCVGGLGNRLFIYAFARVLQLDYDEPIFMYHIRQNGVDIEYYTRELKAMIPADVDITHIYLNRNQSILDVAPMQMFFCRVLRKAWRLTHPNATVANVEKVLQPWWNRLGLCMITDGYLPFTRKTHFQKYVCAGYFQSRRFWGSHSEEIRTELYRPDLISEDSREFLEQIQNTNAVCLHIRLGDYVNDPAVRRLHYVCDEAYYAKAIEAVMAQLEDPTFFAFTNDRVVAEQIPFPSGAKIIWIPSGDAVSDLQLMAQCKHFIIANSSYSWWAQFLSGQPEKVVFAPDRWLRDDTKPMDVYEEDWILIPTSDFDT